MSGLKVDYNDCLRYIKRNLKINLFPYQEVMLKAFCDGLEVRSARAIGRSYVADAFGKYVASTVSQNHYEREPDVILPYTCAIESGMWKEGDIELLKRDSTPEIFEKEMLCK